MTVAELIGRLQALPGDLPVLVHSRYGPGDLTDAAGRVVVIRFGRCKRTPSEITANPDYCPDLYEPFEAVVIDDGRGDSY